MYGIRRATSSIGMWSMSKPIDLPISTSDAISAARSGVSAIRSEPVWTKISMPACCSSSRTMATPSISIRVCSALPRSCPNRPAARPVEPLPSRSRSRICTLAPRPASCMAVLSPATPPPMMITSAVLGSVMVGKTRRVAGTSVPGSSEFQCELAALPQPPRLFY